MLPGAGPTNRVTTFSGKNLSVRGRLGFTPRENDRMEPVAEVGRR